VALFGVGRQDSPEAEVLSRTAIRCFRAADIRKMGVLAAAETAVERIHGGRNELVLHLDVDVISREDFSATDLPGDNALRLDEVRQALELFAKQPRLVALVVAGYNPEKDADGSGAKIIVGLVASALAARLEAQEKEKASAAGAVAEKTESTPVGAEPAQAPSEKASESSETNGAKADTSQDGPPEHATPASGE
jgi:arginase family protein